ncbi:MAG: hypothetical protein ABFD98_15460 [Syntrophobacteraceae bacterium]
MLRDGAGGAQNAGRVAALFAALDGSSWLRRVLPSLILAGGLVLYIAVQGAFTLWPLQGWSLFPEADDTLTYVLKTRQMEECYFQDCPALDDLRRQLYGPSSSPEAEHQRFLAGSRVFPVYHPLFSLILLALGKTGMDLMAAYRLLWHLGPVLFGASFACLLAALFGRTTAGLALVLLAFKVFPDTGLHNVVPSNVTMAAAVFVFARIVARRGDAPYTLAIGSLLLVGMHLVGAVYCVLALALCLALADGKSRKRVLLGAAGAGTAALVPFFISAFARGVPLSVPSLLPAGDGRLAKILAGAAQSLAQVVVEIMRLDGGLLGSLPIFLAAAVLGLMTLTRERRGVVLRFTAVYSLGLFGLLFYVSNHPADVILRVWIPLFVVVLGLTAQAVRICAERSWSLCRDRFRGGAAEGGVVAWPPVVLALLLGYVVHAAAIGGEQMIAIAEHQRLRQPLDFKPEQPRVLLSAARPGDRVLYTSIIVMPYYLLHGAMRLGAVYHHAAMDGDERAREWLVRPDLRFAATYHPLVYHPSFEGMDENRWWITSPDVRFSALSRPRRHGPLAREGRIAASDYRWIEVDPGGLPATGGFRVLVHNPGKRSEMKVCESPAGGGADSRNVRAVPVPAKWSGWLRIDTAETGGRVRLLFPGESAPYSLAGLTFGEGMLLWPWAREAGMTLMPRDDGSGPISVSFDPSDLLPAPLNREKISVLHDGGSSVLLKIDRE